MRQCSRRCRWKELFVFQATYPSGLAEIEAIQRTLGTIPVAYESVLDGRFLPTFDTSSKKKFGVIQTVTAIVTLCQKRPGANDSARFFSRLEAGGIAYSTGRLKLANPPGGFTLAAKELQPINQKCYQWLLVERLNWQLSTPPHEHAIVQQGFTMRKIRNKAESSNDRQTLPLLLRPTASMCRTDRYSKLT